MLPIKDVSVLTKWFADKYMPNDFDRVFKFY